MRKLLPMALLVVSVSVPVTGMAAEFSVTKSMAPFSIYKPGYRGISTFRPTMADYPRGAIGSAKLKSIQWNTTLYPNSSVETVEICLITPGVGEDCKDIAPNATGEAYFNNVPFRYASNLVIRHMTKSGPVNSKPAGKDVVKINMSY